MSMEVVRVALFQMYHSKAPRLDDMSLMFFQRFWSIVSIDVIIAIQSFFHSGKVLKRINYTHVFLIPKVKAPKDVTQFRPTSLCNVIFKIASKVMANFLSSSLLVSSHLPNVCLFLEDLSWPIRCLFIRFLTFSLSNNVERRAPCPKSWT